MAFVVVHFLETDEVAIISQPWLVDRNTCKWPPYENEILIKRALLEKRAPESSWKSREIFILGVHKTYAGAKKEVDLALHSDSDGDDKTPERKSKKIEAILNNSASCMPIVIVKSEHSACCPSTETIFVPQQSVESLTTPLQCNNITESENNSEVTAVDDSNTNISLNKVQVQYASAVGLRTEDSAVPFQSLQNSSSGNKTKSLSEVTLDGHSASSKKSWAENYRFPVRKLPRVLMEGKVPTPSERRELIRLVCSDISEVCEYPKKKHLEVIAEKLCDLFPVAFNKTTNGKVIGPAILLKQMTTRFENVRRSNHRAVRKSSAATNLGKSPKKPKLSDGYRCVVVLSNISDDLPNVRKDLPNVRKDLPNVSDDLPNVSDDLPNVREDLPNVREDLPNVSDDLPNVSDDLPNVSNDVTDQETKKQLLQAYFQRKKWDTVYIETLMNEMYGLQRSYITQCQSFSYSNFKEEFPFLTIMTFFLNHADRLLGFPVKDKFMQAVEKKAPDLLLFAKSRKICNYVKPYQVLEVLVTYFKEDQRQALITTKDGTSLSEIVKDDTFPTTPVIVAFGDPGDIMGNCSLVIEKESLISFMTVLDAIIVWFASFYVFNIKYPADCSTTLVFLQRAFFEINEEKDSKSEKGNEEIINTKIQKLITELAHYKWNG